MEIFVGVLVRFEDFALSLGVLSYSITWSIKLDYRFDVKSNGEL